MPTFFFIAGETSGDKHAAQLIKRLPLRYPCATFAGLGGDQMAAAGCRLYRHIKHMAFMGFAAVISHWKEVRLNFRIAQQALLNEKPDFLVLIDYPSFNLRIAAFCRKHLPRTKIIYYIPPKVWAWKRSRIHAIARLCDLVLGIFPFEPAFYARYGYRCIYVGNPTVEEVCTAPSSSLSPGERRRELIALLPGSRRSEIEHCLPRMLDAARHFPQYQITVAAAPGIEEAFYTPFLRKGETLTRDTYGALRCAAAAVVNSGTATLETALLDCPQVAVYHLACSGLIRHIRKIGQPLLFDIPYFTPVNIIAGREVIKECIADAFTVDNVVTELERLLCDNAYKKDMLASYGHVRSILGSASAAETAADVIATELS